jgi:hypothetical protein
MMLGMLIQGKKASLEFASKLLIYLLTAIGLSPGGSTHLHTNNT